MRSGDRKKVSAVAAAVAVALVAAIGGSLGSASAGEPGSTGPITGQATSYGLSPPVRDLEPSGRASSDGPAPLRINPLAGEPDQGKRGTANRGEVPADPLAATSPAGVRTPPIGPTFEGTANPAACGGCSPPDTVGDVGPNHYIQMVNATKVAIYNKAGTLLEPIFDLGDLWGSGTCSGNAGDPVVVYDEAADRWLLSQFASPNHLCFAVSQTSDPQGSYHLYTFNVSSFPDYFKVGVWPSGYYVSANEASYTAYAFNRTKMLAGDMTANFVKFTGQTNFLLPADVDGPTAPATPGSGLFYTFKDNSFHGGSDRIELFRLTPDFTTPASSTFTLIHSLPIASYTYTVCTFFDLTCIPQAGTSQLVDAVSEWPMHRFAYRNFGDHEALVGNFAVGLGASPGRAGSAIRWFELRNTGSGWSLFQEGTHNEGGATDRFMGSIAIDQAGNIALGYSASSTTLNPSIRYATRAPGDTAGTLQAEQTLQAGGGSQTGSSRWGDYSAMSVDPADDCTFWFTNEYYSSNSATNWKTKIGNFVVPGCGGTPRTLTVNKTGAGAASGLVTSNPAGINCGATCSAQFNDGQAVVLTATAPVGTAFNGWTNCDSAVGNQCTQTLNADEAVTADFITVPTHTLTVAKTGAGTGNVTGPGINCVNGAGDCTEPYNQGAVVNLTATADPGSTFNGWTNCDSPSANTCAETMDAADTVTADFSATPSHLLTVNKTGSGTGTVTSSPAGINCGVDCDQSYLQGTVVTLTPTPGAGSSFGGWTNCDNVVGNSCEETMNAADTVTADFDLIPSHQLTISKTGAGTGNVTGPGINCVNGSGDCTATYLEDTVVNLTAIPATGSSFNGWANCDSPSANTCAETMDGPDTVTADFALVPQPPPGKPSNDFTLGKVKKNKNKGTATIAATFPGPGVATLKGKGLKTLRPTGSGGWGDWAGAVSAATASKVISGAGTVKLKIKAKGAKRAKLEDTGKLKVKPKVTYTPTGGDPATKSKKIKLVDKT